MLLPGTMPTTTPLPRYLLLRQHNHALVLHTGRDLPPHLHTTRLLGRQFQLIMMLESLAFPSSERQLPIYDPI
jgi:hypothetical protein